MASAQGKPRATSHEGERIALRALPVPPAPRTEVVGQAARYLGAGSILGVLWYPLYSALLLGSYCFVYLVKTE